MRGFSSLVMCGSLAKDPTIKHIGQNNTKLVEFYITYGVKVGDNKWENVGIAVKVFGRQADIIEKYCKKGSWVNVVGELKHDRWEKDGKKGERYTLEANKVTLMGDGNQGGESRGEASQDHQEAKPEPSKTRRNEPIPEDAFPDDEIPF